MRESRRYVRFSIEGNAKLHPEVRYRIEGSANLQPEDGTSRVIKADLVDICYLGIGVHSNEEIAAGTDVKFELVAKIWDDPVIGRGKVKYAVKIKKYNIDIFRLGIEFIDINKQIVICIITKIQRIISAQIRKKEQSKNRPY